MRDSEKVLIELSKQAKNKEYQFERLYRILCNPDMYARAYSNIYSNNGSATCGVNSETADGFSENKINQIIESLKNESYQAKPVRRTYIPKKNGKTRPLGIPNFSDRLIQEVCRMILEAIYEPVFSDNSHGFRPNKSCHTALKQIKNTFRGANWFIEGDIKGCFDNIKHQILIDILRKKIKDERFIRLIWKFLKSGYMDDWIYYNTFSGTPQGGIISPILANIYMNEFDTYIEDIIKKEFIKYNVGEAKNNKVYNTDYLDCTHKLEALKKKISKLDMNDEERAKLIVESKSIRKARNNMPAQLGIKDYKNLQYVRYADDFIIAVLGTKNDCIEIKNEITKFLKEKLSLDLSEEKTLITHGREKARFLNYEIQVRENSKFFKDKNGTKRRVGNLGIVLYMPKDVMTNYISKKQVVDDINAEQWKGKSRPYLYGASDLEIVTLYNAEIKGLYNYYMMAENVSSKMDMIYHLMEYSCLKTLAGKHKSSVAQIKTKYRVGDSWGIKYDTKNEKGKIRYFYNQGFQMNSTPIKTMSFDAYVNTAMYTQRTELEQRMNAQKCELCGKENVPFNIHHIRKVKDLKGKEPWERLMIERNRKTLVLCLECHNKIHANR
ncbi:reverse transcriptase domain-containing protein [Anaerocolumna sp. AGMB13025]|uniref:reverse transcriptase domain-containing protein n=1 Tax=Anaerocolumna sp. AGMB13025 TaxID=3039116 RepID=UPI00241CA1EB|nr:reverse transcriptase domain-containing protein [Anaerocolumna sp. AGMB13025]WFR56194.1 reverse transcriptase domain-containing protein [Anaerocolumna sp. AGMB13025]